MCTGIERIEREIEMNAGVHLNIFRILLLFVFVTAVGAEAAGLLKNPLIPDKILYIK